jgi:hypothetical protein
VLKNGIREIATRMNKAIYFVKVLDIKKNFK